MNPKDTHCSRCGRGFSGATHYPRSCEGCSAEVYDNPLPMAVVVVPVGDGIRASRQTLCHQKNSYRVGE